MIILRDTIEIKTSPQKIFKWFTHLDKDYRAWHPKDHVKCCYIKGSPVERDSILYFEEYLHGHLEKMKFQITNAKSNSRVEYRILFPYSLLGMRGSFIIEPYETSSLFTAEIYLGSKIPLFGELLDKFIQIFFDRQLKALKQHMSDEEQNLKRILEEGLQ